MNTGLSCDEVTSYEGGSAAQLPADGSLPKIGRFLTLRLLGTGATGAVYSAYDPELDRKIALKLITLRHGETTAITRVQREVQAMARVRHPNTLQIYDVGEHGSGVYIAMELIEGQTLRMWNEDRHTWREVVEVFAQAGRGLQAAHDAGLVHRDFKPANVLLDETGHVHVADFGLARGGGGLDPVEEPVLRRSHGSSLHSEVTMAGGLIGTPAYMAPELFSGLPADTRSDQYAFAVALYEALYGARPFHLKDTEELREAVIAGVLPPPPVVDPPIPAWLRRAVVRGLEVDPERRFPSLREFIAAIDRDPGKTWRRRILLTGLVGLVALLATALLAPTNSPCDDMEAHLLGIWDDTRRQELNAAVGPSTQLGPEVHAQIEGGLDGFARRWLTMRREACELSLSKRGEDVLSERRIACLDDRLARVRPMVDMLTQLDGAQVIAAEVMTHIPSLDRCADAESMMEVSMLPDDPAIAAEVEDIRLTLAQAKADRMVGNRAVAKELIEQAIERATAVDYGQVYAEALVELSQIQTVEPKFLVPALERAMTKAEQAGDRRLRLAVALELLIYNSKLHRFHAAASWNAVIDGLSPSFEAEPLVVASIARAKGVFAGYGNNNNEAIEHTRRAVAAFARAGATYSPTSTASRSNLGALLSRVHRYEEANTVLRSAYADAVREFGHEHVSTQNIYMNLTTALARGGDGADATQVMLDHIRRGPSVEAQALGTALRIVRVLFEPNSLLAPDSTLRLLPELDRSLALVAEAELARTSDADEAAIRSALENGRCRAEVLLEEPTALAVCEHSVGMAEHVMRSAPQRTYHRETFREALFGLALAEKTAGIETAIPTLRRAIDVELRDANPSPTVLVSLYTHLRRWEDEAGDNEAAAVAASVLSGQHAVGGNSLASFPPRDIF